MCSKREDIKKKYYFCNRAGNGVLEYLLSKWIRKILINGMTVFEFIYAISYLSRKYEKGF